MLNCSLERILFVTPILILAAAVTMMIIAGADENFKPCPSTKRSFHTVKGKQKTVYTTFSNFCGQTMNPRVTTCCRVPCFQNFTTYFDLDGNPDDCFSQNFGEMSLAIVGIICLSISLFFLLIIVLEHVIKQKSKSRYTSLIDRVFSPSVHTSNVSSYQATTTPQRADLEAIPDTTTPQQFIDEQTAPDIFATQAFSKAEGATELQVV
jgi:hypothetical protein